ncbi:MAG: bifunctional metallophosphatase/5'-nucleotidase, partial [Clostridium sp.]|nr:bifunctional metallophosphatase/5'-nucleotidase [Clostridium sp.]
FQINKRVQAVYSDKEKQLVSFTVDGKDVLDEGTYTVRLKNYHVANSEANLGLTNVELIAGGNPKVVSTSTRPVLEEWLRVNPNVSSKIEGRIVYKSE